MTDFGTESQDQKVGPDQYYPGIQKIAYRVNISREMALMYGLVEPTPEEAAEREEAHREWVIESNKRALIREAAWGHLRGIAEPALAAVIKLHGLTVTRYGDDVCDHCREGDMQDPVDWPCDTIRAICTAYGIEVPAW